MLLLTIPLFQDAALLQFLEHKSSADRLEMLVIVPRAVSEDKSWLNDPENS